MDNSAPAGRQGFGAPRPPMPKPSFPPKRSTLVESYNQDALNGFEKYKPRTNPMNQEHAQTSVFVNLKDPVQVHLLTETALFDSKEYVILSEDEIDNLKKQCQLLTQRIEQARSNLTIQSKYRDAAVSMTRLYSPTGNRTSSSANRLSAGSDDAREAEAERDAIQKKCEDLAAELWSLEQQLIEPQRRLLEHTAGILQHAHKMAQKTASAKNPLVNAVPASPESMHTTSNGRNSINFLEDGFVFDEASLYRSFDMTESLGSQSRHNNIGIPLRSPVREQNKQLVEETDKLRQENEQLRSETNELRRENEQLRGEADEVHEENKELRSETDELRQENEQLQSETDESRQENKQLRSEIEALLAEFERLRRQESDQWNMISDTERKLENSNQQVRDIIVKIDPNRNGDYDSVPAAQQQPGGMLISHLSYLQNSLFLIGQNQNNNAEIAQRLQSLNSQMHEILVSVDPNHPQAPSSIENIEEQLHYLQESLQAVHDELQRAANMTHLTSVDKQKSEQSDAVLKGLWDIIQSGYADIRQRKQERRQAHREKGLEPDEEDLSDGDSIDVNETYSLPAFSSKIQWLYTQATRLNEQKAVLKRQIKQQRELNSKSDSEKDQQLRDRADELEEAQVRLRQAEQETDKVRSQLSQTFEELETFQNSRSQEAAAIEQSRDELNERNTKVASLEAETRDFQARLDATEANIEMLTLQLREATDAKAAAEKAADERQNIIKAKEQELEQMTGMVAELKMETAMTKAELDGAYGSRKQRAAEVAALQNTSQSAKMQSRVESLEQELQATASDLTDVVKQSLESEKRIAELEDELDKVKAERDRIRDEQGRINGDLERQLHEATSDLKERMEAEVARLRKEKESVQDELDRERLKGGVGTASPSGISKTSYLTDSYRHGLRAERKKYEEQLRAEQMLRRKIEDELRALKRAQGPGKSPLTLSPR